MKKDLYTAIRKQNGLLIRDVWYDDSREYSDTDVVYYMQMKKPFGDEYYEQYTLLIDLREEEQTIYNNIGKNCRFKIQSIENKKEHTYHFWTSPDAHELKRFIDDYNRFAKRKGINPADESRMNQYVRLNLLQVSETQDHDGSTVVWHVYRVNSSFAYLLYTMSATQGEADSQQRNKIGMANRYTHWRDIQEFKKHGIQFYDFGGWYRGKEDEEKLRINKFKEEFGGMVTENYNCITYHGLKGAIFKRLKHLKNIFSNGH